MDKPKSEGYNPAMAESLDRLQRLLVGLSWQDGVLPDSEGLVLQSAEPVSGGDINQAFRVETATGEVWFVKTHAQANGNQALPGLFEAEAKGLQAMTQAAGDGLLVPKVLACGASALLLAWCDFQPLGPQGVEALGQQVARMHQVSAKAQAGGNKSNHGFGFDQTSYLARLALDNTWQSDWATFWLEQRFKPMLSRLPSDDGLEKIAKDVLAGIPKWLGPDSPAFDEPPVLVHGDLWSGNAAQVDGVPSLFDPAAFYAHREFEFGMTRLFGFGHGFEQGYESVWPLAEGWQDRAGLYRAYHLMNHWLHFGASYRKQTIDALHQVLAALG